MLEWNQQSKLTFFEWGGKRNKFKPKPQNMQSRIKNCDKKISLSTYPHHGAAAKTTREREKGKTPTPIHTKIHTSSRALWLIGRRVGLGFWGNENQIGKRVVFSEWVWGFVVVLAEGREWFSVRRVDGWGGLDLRLIEDRVRYCVCHEILRKPIQYWRLYFLPGWAAPRHLKKIANIVAK